MEGTPILLLCNFFAKNLNENERMWTLGACIPGSPHPLDLPMSNDLIQFSMGFLATTLLNGVIQ